MTKSFWCTLLLFAVKASSGQFADSITLSNSPNTEDSSLRIINLNPYFTQHVDSVLSYQFEINRDQSKYYWFLKNSPVGLKIKDDGMLTFRAEKSYFLSGKLKYDFPYKVAIGVQNLLHPTDRVDTSFTL